MNVKGDHRPMGKKHQLLGCRRIWKIKWWSTRMGKVARRNPQKRCSRHPIQLKVNRRKKNATF